MRTWVFEEGGKGDGVIGEAVIVCDSAGRPLRVDAEKQKQIAGKPNEIQGVFLVYGFDLIVTATFDGKSDEPFSWTVTQVAGGIVANGYSVAEAPDYLQAAVLAAVNKTVCENCKHIHYQLVEGKDG